MLSAWLGDLTSRDLDIGVILMRPFAAGGLVGRSPSAGELAPLAGHGVTTWPQALLKYGSAIPRCRCRYRRRPTRPA